MRHHATICKLLSRDMPHTLSQTRCSHLISEVYQGRVLRVILSVTRDMNLVPILSVKASIKRECLFMVLSRRCELQTLSFAGKVFPAVLKPHVETQHASSLVWVMLILNTRTDWSVFVTGLMCQKSYHRDNRLTCISVFNVYFLPPG